jgi:hypothetical protein
MQGRVLPRERPLALVLPSAVPTSRHAHCSRRASSVGPSGRSGHFTRYGRPGTQASPPSPPLRVSFPARSKAVGHLPAALRCSAHHPAHSAAGHSMPASSVAGDFGMLRPTSPELRPRRYRPGEMLQQEAWARDHPFDLGGVHALVRGVDPRGRQVLGSPHEELGRPSHLLQMKPRPLLPPDDEPMARRPALVAGPTSTKTYDDQAGPPIAGAANRA